MGCCSVRRLDRPVAPVVDACREQGLLVLSAGADVLRLTPPLVVAERTRWPRRSRCSRACSRHEPARAAGRDPARSSASARSRPRPSSRRRCARRATRSCRRRSRATSPSSGSSRCARRAGGSSTRRPGTGDADRLRAIGAAMRRYAHRRRGGGRRAHRRHDPVRVRERARAGDRRGRPSRRSRARSRATTRSSSRRAGSRAPPALRDELAGHLARRRRVIARVSQTPARFAESPA